MGDRSFRCPAAMIPAALAVFFAAALPSCEDGGWGGPSPDTIIGDPPDGGAITDRGSAFADSASADAPGTGDVAGGGDTGVTYACGEGPGNEKGVGKPCAAGGGECTGDLSCDRDLDPQQGVGICILLMCTADRDCGSGATCCTPAQGGGIKICLINECLPPECGGAAVDGGTTDGGGGGDGA